MNEELLRTFHEARATAGAVRQDPIPAAVVALYRRCRELQAAAAGKEWGSEPWKESRAACFQLHKLLGRKPWQFEVTEGLGDEPPAGDQADWAGAAAIRRQLDEMIAA